MQPYHYVSHLLGHESDGSLLSALKKAGWSDSLMAGKRTAARGSCNFFTIVVDLTEEGIQHVDDIIALLFQYINMLKKEGPVEWIFDVSQPIIITQNTSGSIVIVIGFFVLQEYRQISKMDFDFKEKSLPRIYVSRTVRALQKYPIEEVLTASSIYTDWRPDLINLIVDHLVPENIRVYVVGKTFEDIATETEPWYGVKFKKEKIPQDIIDRWNTLGLSSELAYPTKNEFIPEDFVIRANEKSVIEKFPTIIDDSPLMRVWFKQDDEFLVPKVNLTFEFIR